MAPSKPTSQKLTTSMNRSLDQISRHLVRLRRPLAKLLGPGLDFAQIAQLTNELPFKLSPELVVLYSRVNGCTTRDRRLGDLWIIPGYRLLALEEAIEVYGQQRRYAARRWKAAWFPVLTDDAGDFFVVACGARAARSVIAFENEEPRQEVEYVSLDRMLKTFAEGYEKGAFSVRRGDLDVDDEKLASIARKHNPRVARWQVAKKSSAERREEEARALADQALKLGWARNPVEAHGLFERALALSFETHSQQVYVNALFALVFVYEQGKIKPAKLRSQVEKILARGRHHADAYWNAACAYVLLGDHDSAIANLRQAKRRGVDLKRCLKDKTFAPLASDKRFMALKRSAGLKSAQ